MQFYALLAMSKIWTFSGFSIYCAIDMYFKGKGKVLDMVFIIIEEI